MWLWDGLIPEQTVAVVLISLQFYRKQWNPLNIIKIKTEKRLVALRNSINGGKRRKEDTVMRKISRMIRHDRIKEFFSYELVISRN
jgi:hypothetical protein